MVSIRRLRGIALPLLVLVLTAAGCTSTPVDASAPVSTPASSASTEPSAEPLASPTTAGSSASATALGSACMSKTTLDLLQQNLDNLATLPVAQRDEIVAALTAYDFGADATGATWRDGFVAALKNGDATGSFATAWIVGTVSLKACP